MGCLGCCSSPAFNLKARLKVPQIWRQGLDMTRLLRTHCSHSHIYGYLSCYLINILKKICSWISICILDINIYCRWLKKESHQKCTVFVIYSRTSVTQTRMARLPRLIRTCFWVPTKFLWTSSKSVRKQILKEFSYYIMKLYVLCTH